MHFQWLLMEKRSFAWDRIRSVISGVLSQFQITSFWWEEGRKLRRESSQNTDFNIEMPDLFTSGSIPSWVQLYCADDWGSLYAAITAGSLCAAITAGSLCAAITAGSLYAAITAAQVVLAAGGSESLSHAAWSYFIAFIRLCCFHCLCSTADTSVQSGGFKASLQCHVAANGLAD